MKEDITQKRNLSVWYINASDAPNYKNEIGNFLKEEENNIKKIGLGKIIIDLFYRNKREDTNPTGHMRILDLEDDANRFKEVCKYILSKDRRFIPKEVKCKNREDYKMIEEILEENYKGNIILKNNFWEYGRIIVNKNK
jgi:hypothetical protein